MGGGWDTEIKRRGGGGGVGGYWKGPGSEDGVGEGGSEMVEGEAACITSRCPLKLPGG